MCVCSVLSPVRSPLSHHPKVESKCESLERATKPYAALLSRPESALTVYDNCPRGNKISSFYDGDQPLSTEELLWLGTAITVGGPPHSAYSPASLPTAPQWLLMPVYDVSLKVGFKGADLVGTLPGQCAVCTVMSAYSPTSRPILPSLPSSCKTIRPPNGPRHRPKPLILRPRSPRKHSSVRQRPAWRPYGGYCEEYRSSQVGSVCCILSECGILTPHYYRPFRRKEIYRKIRDAALPKFLSYLQKSISHLSLADRTFDMAHIYFALYDMLLLCFPDCVGYAGTTRWVGNLYCVVYFWTNPLKLFRLVQCTFSAPTVNRCTIMFFTPMVPFGSLPCTQARALIGLSPEGLS